MASSQYKGKIPYTNDKIILALQNLQTILTDIKNRKFKPFYFLYGEEAFFIDQISDYIEDIIEELDSAEKLDFIKAEEAKNATPRFKVGLGVMPDYLYDEGGMKISAITSDEKPAGKAGLQKNDIVIKMGDINVIDMMSYMNALSTFKEGDITIIQIKREGKILDFTIKF